MSSPQDKVKLVIDGRPLVGNRTGIGVHTAEILERLALGTPPLIASHAEVDNRTGIERCRFRVDRRPLGVVWQQLDLPRIARANGNLLWGPHGTLPWLLDIPSVVTMHDLTSLTMPAGHRFRTLVSFNLFVSRSLELATRIAAVSRWTADEVMRGFGVSAKKIDIVPNGVSDFFSPAEDEDVLPAGLQAGDYILYVGTVEPRKGIVDLLSSWESLPSPRPRLVLAGDAGWGERGLRRRLNEYNRTGEIVVTGYVDRTTLRALYRQCMLFVYPSRSEGFGLPPLEAMACGAPVVAARAGAIPEVVGDAAVLVTPGDSEALAGSIKRLLSDAGWREDLRLRGISRAAQFRWEHSAARMGDLLEAAVERG